MCSCALCSLMGKLWLKIGSGISDWVLYERILIRAFENDPWYKTVIPQHGERSQFIAKDFRESYEVDVKNGKGGFATINTTENGKDKVIGGICVLYKNFFTLDENFCTNGIWRRRHLMHERITPQMQDLANQHDTELWYMTMQAVDTNYQSHSIGRSLMTEAVNKIVEEKMKKEELKNYPLLYGIGLHDTIIKIGPKLGWSFIGSVDINVDPYGRLPHHVGMLLFKGKNDKILNEARKIYFNQISNL